MTFENTLKVQYVKSTQQLIVEFQCAGPKKPHSITIWQPRNNSTFCPTTLSKLDASHNQYKRSYCKDNRLYVNLKWLQSTFLSGWAFTQNPQCVCFQAFVLFWFFFAGYYRLSFFLSLIVKIIQNHFTRSSPSASALNCCAVVMPGWNAHRLLVKGH